MYTTTIPGHLKAEINIKGLSSKSVPCQNLPLLAEMSRGKFALKNNLKKRLNMLITINEYIFVPEINA